MSLTPTPGDQRTEQLAKVNPISLHPTAAPIDLHACRVNHEALDATHLEEAREPKGIVARLVAEYGLSAHAGRACRDFPRSRRRPGRSWTSLKHSAPLRPTYSHRGTN